MSREVYRTSDGRFIPGGRPNIPIQITDADSADRWVSAVKAHYGQQASALKAEAGRIEQQIRRNKGLNPVQRRAALRELARRTTKLLRPLHEEQEQHIADAWAALDRRIFAQRNGSDRVSYRDALDRAEDLFDTLAKAPTKQDGERARANIVREATRAVRTGDVETLQALGLFASDRHAPPLSDWSDVLGAWRQLDPHAASLQDASEVLNAHDGQLDPGALAFTFEIRESDDAQAEAERDMQAEAMSEAQALLDAFGGGPDA